MHERAADGSGTMQMRVSLGEERPGTAVEKHMGPGHPNVHLRETVPQIFFDPSDFFFFFALNCLFVFNPRRSRMLTDKQKGEVKCEHFKITARQQQVSQIGQSWFRHRSFWGAGGTTHPAVVSPAHDNTMTYDM